MKVFDNLGVFFHHHYDVNDYLDVKNSIVEAYANLIGKNTNDSCVLGICFNTSKKETEKESFCAYLDYLREYVAVHGGYEEEKYVEESWSIALYINQDKDHTVCDMGHGTDKYDQWYEEWWLDKKRNS